MSTVADCDKEASVVGLLLTTLSDGTDVAKCCQQAADDRGLLITLCIQHYTRDRRLDVTKRRAGPSASAVMPPFSSNR